MKIIACLATSLDGKIAPDHTEGQLTPIGSRTDIDHLKSIRNQADAILIGGATFRVFPNRLPAADFAHSPVHCILTKGQHWPTDLPPESPIFKTNVAVRVYCQTLPDASEKAQYPDSVSWIPLPASDVAGFIAGDLEKIGIKTLSVEGGGHVVGLFLKAQLIEEFYLTLCPLFLAGGQANRLVSTDYFSLDNAPRTNIINQKTVGDEIFLHLKLLYSGVKA